MSTRPPRRPPATTVGGLVNRPLSLENRQALNDALSKIGPSESALRSRFRRRGFRVVRRERDTENGPYMIVDPLLDDAVIARGLDMIGLQQCLDNLELTGYPA